MFFAVKEKTIFDAHELYLEGKYDKALSLCEQILAKNPESYSAINLIANIYFIKGDFEKGEQYLFKLKDFYLKRKEYDKAIAILERLMHIQPQNVHYMKQIAEIFDLDGREIQSIRMQLKIAEIYRHSGDFKACSGIYTELTAMYPDKPDLTRKCINSLTLLGAHDKLFKVVKSKVLPSSNFDRDEKDDLILLCVENGAGADVFGTHLADFLKGGQDRLTLIENSLIKYFTEKRDDRLFLEIAKVIGWEALEEIIKIVSLTSPENIPEKPDDKPIDVVSTVTSSETVSAMDDVLKRIELLQGKTHAEEQPYVPEPEETVSEDIISEQEETTADVPEETAEPIIEKFEKENTDIDIQPVEIESHMDKGSVDVEPENIELESLLEDSGEIKVDAEISGLEKFETTDSEPDVATLDGLESFDFEVPVTAEPQIEPKTEPITEPDEIAPPEPVAMEEFEAPAKEEGDIFASFDTDDKPDDSDIFASFEQEAETITEKPKIEQIDMSDVQIEIKQGEDMFADLENQEKEKEPSKPPQKKITLDKDDIKPTDNKGKDIFDMEV